MPLTGSKKLNFLLGEMGIFSYFDVINHYPRKYDDFTLTDPKRLYSLSDKEKVVLFGQVVSSPKTMHFRKVSRTNFLFRVANMDFPIIAWNRPYLAKMIVNNEFYTMEASYDSKTHGFNLLQVKKGEIAKEDTIVPIYSLPKDYAQHLFRQLVGKSLQECKGKIYDHVPAYFAKKYRLISREQAINELHFPSDEESLHQAKRTLKYEEALIFSLKNQLIRKANRTLVREGKPQIDRQKVKDFIATLPYPLTSSQKTALGEIIRDLDDVHLMYRLLQGDVGMGKTLVASLAMYAVYTRGEQSALMAPTDTLAKQHYQNLRNMFDDLGIKTVLLVGSLTKKQRSEALEEIASGEANFIIGTHALFTKDVDYLNLGLAIIDEQHKFGVNQRATLSSKGDNCDLLLMSATPIPRTLSMTFYGDLDVSTLTEFPAKKRKTATKIVKSKDSCINKTILNSLNNDGRVYVVAPQIEIGEEGDSSVLSLYLKYEEKYPGKCVLLHGKMNNEDKEVALASFAGGLTPIIVATSVIEVGIDVKQSDLMIIHDPSHFSLSSLHQLRGRIGRNGQDSICYLAYDDNDEEEKEKLQILVDYEDGFKIAEEDLRRRGPGELIGTKQSGIPSLEMANIVSDFKMFEAARDDAAFILNNAEEKGFAYILNLARNGLGEFVP